MRLAAADGHQPAHAADVAGRQMQAAVPFLQFIGQHVDGVVVAADHDQGMVQLLVGPQQPHPHRFAQLHALQFLRDLEDAVGSGERGDHPGAPLQRHGDQPPLDAPQDDPDKLLQTQAGRQFSGPESLPLRGGWAGQTLQVKQERSHKLLKRQDGRHRITRNTHHRLIPDHPQDRGFTRHHGHPMDQHLTQFLNERLGVVLGTGRRTGIDQNDLSRTVHGLFQGRF